MSTATTKHLLTTAALSELDRGKPMFQKPDQTRDKARPIDERCLANPILQCHIDYMEFPQSLCQTVI